MPNRGNEDVLTAAYEKEVVVLVAGITLIQSETAWPSPGLNNVATLPTMPHDSSSQSTVPMPSHGGG